MADNFSNWAVWQNNRVTTIDFPSPLKCPKLCLTFEAQSITLWDMTHNVCG